MPRFIATDYPTSSRPKRDSNTPAIKENITIPMVAEKFLAGWDPYSGKSPFRDDNHKGSFSVSRDGKLFNDFADPDGSGSVIDFYKKLKGCDLKTAIADLEGWLGGGVFVPAEPIIYAPAKKEERKPMDTPERRIPTAEELQTISDLRTIRVEALQVAVDRGFLRTATSNKYNCECWLVLDRTLKNCRARRMVPSGDLKVVPVERAQAGWPIGIEEAQDFPCIALCEGEPDFLSAFDHALTCGTVDRVAPVCMAGASNKIPDEVIPLFTGKRVRIFMHADKPGHDARDRWVQQIFDVAKTITSFDIGDCKQLNGDVAHDLNDLLKIHPDCLERNREQVANIMRF